MMELGADSGVGLPDFHGRTAWTGRWSWLLILTLTVAGCQRPKSTLTLPASAPVPLATTATASAVAALALLDEAIAAHGGAVALARLRCYQVRQSGVFRLGGADVKFSSSTWESPPDCLREEQVLQEYRQGVPVAVTYVKAIAGARAWAIAGETSPADLNGEQQASLEENRHYGRVVRLLDLKDAATFQLAVLGPAKVEGQPVDRLEVVSAGQPTFVLSFDHATKLLLKTEAKVREPNLTDRLPLQEVFFTDYRTVEGLKYPFRQSVWWDGNRIQTAEVTELKFFAELPVTLFARPKD